MCPLNNVFPERGKLGFHYNPEKKRYEATTREDVDKFLRSSDVTVEYLFRASRHVFGTTMLDSDAPQTLLIKREVARFFTVKAVKCYEQAFIKRIIKETIRSIRDSEDSEILFHKSVAQRIPTKVILVVYGIDDSLDLEVYPHLEKVVSYIDDPHNSLSEARSSRDFLIDFLSQCLDGKKAVSQGGLLNLLDKNVFEDRQDLLNTLLMVLVAGMATTIAAFGSLLLKMYANQERTSDLQAERDFDTFIHELLMSEPPLHTTVRFAKSDFLYKGKLLKKHDNIRVNLANANYEQICPANGHQGDEKNTSYTFGKGRHACLGSHLAIAELSVFVACFSPIMHEFTLGNAPEDLELSGATIKSYSNVKLYRTP